MVLKTKDLIYPGLTHPIVVDPIDPDPVLYADAIRLLAETGQLPREDAQRAATLIDQWWPQSSDDGFGWIASLRALRSVNSIDALDRKRLADLASWATTALRSPLPSGESGRKTIVGAEIAAELLLAEPAADVASELDASLLLASARLTCENASTLDDAVVSAALARMTQRPCHVSPDISTAAADLGLG